MTQQRVPETPEKAQQQIKSIDSDSSSVQSFQRGLPPVAQLQRTLGNRQVAKLIQAKRLTPEGKIIGLQRKLTVGAADDQYEKEADQVARQVMNTPDAAVANSMQRDISPEEEKDEMLQTKPLADSITPFVQREIAMANDEDKEEPIQAKSAVSMSDSFEAGNTIENQLSQSKGRGNPLPDPVRSFMEPRFGVDFSQVRVHTGNDANQMNRDVGAQAFTHGSDVYFGEGRSPGNLDLTAHELTHVIQQTDNVQRAASDFQIRQISPADAANPDMIFFDTNKTSLAASEQAKIPALATPPGRNLTLNGFSSEEGSDADNDALIQTRLQGVKAALIAAGHTGARALVNLRTSGVGQIDYRHQRSVEVLPTPIGLPAAPSTQTNCSAPGAINAPCGAAFSAAFPVALTAMANAFVHLANPADAAANALASRLFAGVARATINSNMSALLAQVAALPTQHQCHSDCDAGCGRPAYQSGTGIGPGGAMMTLCPDFLSGTNNMFNAQTLVHEAAHGTTGLSAEDIAYSNTRQIAFLSPADAVRNTDSYVLLAFELAMPGSMTIGPATPDTVVGMTAAEENSARQALAWLESWMNYGDFDTEILYDTVNRSISPAPAWDTSQSGDLFNIETMHLIAPVFGLTDPGAAAPFVQPTKTDKVKIAAIHDRYDQMYGGINQQVLNASKGAAGSGSWQSHGASLPRLGQNVVLAPAFFAMTPADQVKDLVLLMATAMSGISAGFRIKYVDAMDLIRIHRGLGP